MATKEQIKAEIDSIDEEYLDELYALVRSFTLSRKQASKGSFMSKFKSVRIDAPDDFAANLDMYVSGEKRADSDIC
jgi:hypothetical protein